MEQWHSILGWFALAGFFWLASLSAIMLRLLMGAWGLCMLAGGVLFVVGLPFEMAKVPWSSTVDALNGLFLAVFLCVLGPYLLYAGFQMIRASLGKWD